jgi:uncharacterized protein YecA (UPF0149 family)
MSFQVGPSSQYVGQSLYAAYWSLVQTLGLLADHFEMPDRPRIAELAETAYQSFFRLTEEQRRSTGRNDPCPCDSGRKFKHCHGG